MITKEMLLAAQVEATEKIKPLKEEFRKHQLEFDDKVLEFETPLLDLLDQYYDENLKDQTGKPVRKGNTITDGKYNYYVEKRGMQIVFGTMLFNPRVICKKVDEKGYSKANAKELHIHPSGLDSYWIIKK